MWWTQSPYCSVGSEYLFRYQWCEWKRGDEKSCSLTGLHLSDAAYEAGLDVILFFVGEFLKIRKAISVMSRLADILSICSLWRLLKQIFPCQRCSSWENVANLTFQAMLSFGRCDDASIVAPPAWPSKLWEWCSIMLLRLSRMIEIFDHPGYPCQVYYSNMFFIS